MKLLNFSIYFSNILFLCCLFQHGFQIQLLNSASVYHRDVLMERDIHFYFYLWYGAPEEDGQWKHWDHEVLPHWTKQVNKQYPEIGKRHSPPQIIHSPYYPLKGPYSTKNREVIMQQFDEMIQAGGTVAVISWWGQSSKGTSTDTQGISTDLILHDFFAVADEFQKIKIMFHLEPYKDRNIESIQSDIEYIFDQYSKYSSFYTHPNSHLPVFYVYDSYHIPYDEWGRLLLPHGDLTIRYTTSDAIFIGLWLDKNHGEELLDYGFDGIYTYFASESFSYGSSVRNWKQMCQYCHNHKYGHKACILSVGPGYNDTGIRPWNYMNTKDRREGEYFSKMYEEAIYAEPDIISVTSFNEWGEGTQIEPARDYNINHPSRNQDENVDYKTYLTYGSRGPYLYLHISNFYSQQFKEQEHDPSLNSIVDGNQKRNLIASFYSRDDENKLLSKSHFHNDYDDDLSDYIENGENYNDNFITHDDDNGNIDNNIQNEL